MSRAARGKGVTASAAPTVSDAMRANFRAEASKLVCSAPVFTDADATFGTPAAYAERLEKGLFDKFGASAQSYRSQLLALLANIKNLLPELGAMEPEDLAVLDPADMVSTVQRKQLERQQRRRAKLRKLWDDTNLTCSKCQRQRRSRLNTNRCDIDDPTLGNQFDNLYADGVWCECEGDELSKGFGEGAAGADDADDSDVDVDDEGRRTVASRKKRKASDDAEGEQPGAADADPDALDAKRIRDGDAPPLF